MGTNIFDIILLVTFILAGISFVLTAISAIEAFFVTKGQFNRHLSSTDISNALKNSFLIPLSWVLSKSLARMQLQSQTPLAYSYIGLFLSFITSVLGGIIWVIFFRDMTETAIASLVFFFWYVSIILKNIGINAFHLRLIAAHMKEEDL